MKLKSHVEKCNDLHIMIINTMACNDIQQRKTEEEFIDSYNTIREFMISVADNCDTTTGGLDMEIIYREYCNSHYSNFDYS